MSSGDLPFYADQAWQGLVEIAENRRLAEGTFCLRFACEEIAAGVLPGQFVMLKLANSADPLLGRPFAVYKISPGEDGKPLWIDLVYLAVGKMTNRLAAMRAGDVLEVWGPLGKPFRPGRGCGSSEEIDHLIMVAGGVGQTPFYMLAQEALGRRTHVTLCYGARNEACMACVDDFRELGAEVVLATDDGSAGHHGLVTDLIRPAVEAGVGRSQIVCCGPKPMMAAAAGIAKQLGIPCQVSLEERMACGIGVCFSCVAKVKDAEGGWTYRRTCLDGPVFDAERIEF
jgi:dihydroorotate dehydrogenase electron transfer subunit